MSGWRLVVVLAAACAFALAAPVLASADTVGPVIGATSPATGTTVIAPVTLSASAQDLDLIDGPRCAFLVDGAPAATPTVTYGGYWTGDGCSTWWVDDFTTATVRTSVAALSYGPHTVTFQAYDRLGNLSTSSWSIVQSTPLTFSNPVPPNGSRHISLSHVEVSMAGVGILPSSVGMRIDDMTVTASYAPIDAGHGRAVYDGAIGDGTHTVTVWGGDGSAVATTTWSFLVDHTITGPTLSALSPADGTLVQGPFTLSVHATASVGVDGAGSRLWVDGTALAPSVVQYGGYWASSGCGTYWVEDPTSVDLQFSVPDLAPGTHPLTLDVYDRTAIVTGRTLSVVRSAHLAFSGQAPADGSKQRSVTQVQVGISGGEVNPASVTMALDGVPVAVTWLPLTSASGNAVYAGPVADGPHTVVVTATDMTGSPAARTQWSFWVDSVPPALNVTPVDGSTMADAASGVTLVASDADGIDPASMVIKSDGTTLSPVVTASIDATTTSAKWSGILSEGPHTLWGAAADTAGNVTTGTWSFTVADPPRFGTPSPGPGGIAGRAATITVPISDVNDALDTGFGAELTLDGSRVPASFTPTDAMHAIVTAAVSPLVNGVHSASLRVRDSHGNVGTLDWTFNVDTTPPSVVGGTQSPAAGATLSTSTASIGAKFYDVHRMDPSATLAWLDGAPAAVNAAFDGAWVPDSFGCSSYWQPDPTTLVVSFPSAVSLHDGPHSVTVRTADVLGNPADHTWSFNVVEYPAISGIRPVSQSKGLDATIAVAASVSDFDGIRPGSVRVDWRVANYGHPAGVWQSLVASASGSVSKAFVPPTTETRYEFLFSATDVTGYTTTATTDYYLGTARATMQSETSCTVCHTTIFSTHRMDNCAACHGDPRGACPCHGTAMHSTAYLDHATIDEHGAIWTGRTCADCHNHYPDTEAQRHSTTSQVSCGQCHARALTTEHQGRLDAAGLAFTCSSCHRSTDTTITAAIASRNTACAACHAATSGHESVHVTTSLQSACLICHQNNVSTEHVANSKTQTSPRSCDTCHKSADPRVAGVIAEQSLDCFGCHSYGHGVQFASRPATDVPLYPDYAWSMPERASIYAGLGWMPTEFVAAGRIVVSSRRSDVTGDQVSAYYASQMAASGWSLSGDPPPPGSDFFVMTFFKTGHKAIVFFYGGPSHQATPLLPAGHRIEVVYK
ncbi:MAG TPA: hypothetical protein VGK50_07875 [Coriobacteriia bacterium]|jgi:hypothetical protein